MEIKNIKATCGPNYWSVSKQKLIVMELDIQELETQPTNEISGFYPRIRKVFPGLYEHYCSEGEPGGFFSRVKDGTWIGHVIEHIALELQILAGLEVGFGRTRGTGIRGVYDVVFECGDEESGRLAAKKAVSIARELIDGKEMIVDDHVQEIRKTNLQSRAGPSTSSLLSEAEARDIPHIKIKDSIYQLGYGCHQKKIEATITSHTSNMAVERACDKEDCRKLFRGMSIPIAEGDVVSSVEELEELIDAIGFPLVAKPVSGNQGRGVTTNIQSYDTAVKAFKSASEISEAVILERHIPGDDYRLLTVDGKFVAAAKRTPARVQGDGESTIQQLIDEVNRDPRRGDGHEKSLTKISIGPAANTILSKKGYTLETVLSNGEILHLDHVANLSKGGTAEDVTDKVHPAVAKMAERVSEVVGLDICGIDVMATTLEQPLRSTGGVILEVNAAPGFRMHLSPSEGESRNVAAPVLDMLFPEGNHSRIPITAVTGTNGKTTTTRLISHIMKNNGRKVGYTTTDGVYVNDQLLMKGDCGGPKSAEMVLRDPTVDTAVLECARGGILRSGLGFDKCDVGVVTNVASDHLGIDGINTLSQMARVKSVVPDSVHDSGYAVLNADDDRVYGMCENLSCNIVLFSMDAENPRLAQHRQAGGVCAVYKDRHVVIWDGDKTYSVEQVENIPLSFGGRAVFMIENILAAVAACYVQDVDLRIIHKSLKNFEPSPEQTPGRMNIFNFDDFEVMVDYAHNPAGMKAIQKFLDGSSYSHKTGIVTAIGDRRKEDSLEVGRISAEIFDEVIIREDSDLRGKEPGEAINIIKEGIARSPYNPSVSAIPNEKEAISTAMEKARSGSLIVHCAENVNEVIDFVNKQQAKRNSRKLPVLKKHFDSKIAAGMQSL